MRMQRVNIFLPTCHADLDERTRSTTHGQDDMEKQRGNVSQGASNKSQSTKLCRTKTQDKQTQKGERFKDATQ
eukprot:m.187792 g.187792  ORF g.187792 m.187792 type:complete len:73 (+) comp14781_c0_seq1:218-436(+)